MRLQKCSVWYVGWSGCRVVWLPVHPVCTPWTSRSIAPLLSLTGTSYLYSICMHQSPTHMHASAPHTHQYTQYPQNIKPLQHLQYTREYEGTHGESMNMCMHKSKPTMSSAWHYKSTYTPLYLPALPSSMMLSKTVRVINQSNTKCRVQK